MEILDLYDLPFSTKLTSSNDQHVHSHTFYECFYVNEGNIYHEADGKSILLKTGDAVIIAPYRAHCFRRIPGQSCIHRDNLISTDIFEKCCNLIDPGMIDKLNREHFIKYELTQSDMENFEKSVSSYIMSQNTEQMKKYNYCLVISLLSRLIISNKDTDYTGNEFASKCNIILTACFAHPNAVNRFYEQLGYNKSYASKKFKENFGITITEKINELKINYSAYLLWATDYTIPEICEKIGIESVSYFHKLFKKYYGTTPHKKNIKQNIDS